MKRFSKNLTIYILLFAIVFGVAYFFNGQQNTEIKTTEIELSKFISYLDREMISEVEVNGVMVTGKTGENEYVYCYVPSAYEVAMLDEQYLFPMAKEGKIVYKSPKPSTGSFWLNVIPNILMIGAMVFLFYIMMNGGGNGKAFQFAKSRARQVKGEKTTFDDVAGLEEEKAELEEIVDFLKNPGKYNELGARIPKGVLLVGPPGTGKTYISRAAAGEAGVPFFTISGSDFVEMFVGVGASRVRDLFGEAKKNAPCIVFIDEIDAVGRKRGSGIGGGHDEREQTLNQLLVEMDGFAPNAGIIVMAATNRPDVLDPALLRPGRFDRQIVIGLPDVKGREALIKVHSRNKPLADDVTPEILARRTMGFTPADLENVLNEAALITARRNGRFIRMEEIEEAIRKVQMGPAKKSRVVSDEDKKFTAYHEAGHAVVSRSLPKHMDVHEVTIIPRGRAGGYTMYLPEDDNMFQTRQEMYNHIVTSMGGRVAEKLKMDDISVGASGDIQQATNIAREMVTKYGFSDQLGNVNYGGDGEVFLGADLTAHKTYSEETASMIDEEIRRIIGEAFSLAEKILTENNDRLERVAQALLLVETIDGEQFEALYTGAMEPEDLKKSVDEEKELQKKQDEVEAKETERILREKAEIEARDAAQREKGYITLGEAYDGEDPDTKEGE